MVSGGKLNSGKKDELWLVPVGSRFCLCWRRGEARLPTSSPLKSSQDLVPQMYLILCKLMCSLLAWVKLSGSSGIVIPSPHYITVYFGFLYEI